MCWDSRKIRLKVEELRKKRQRKNPKRCSKVKQTGQVQVCVKNIVGGVKGESRDTAVGIVTRLKPGRPSSHGSVPGKEKCVVAFTNPLYRPLDLSIFPLLRIWNFSLGLKRLEREDDHLP
jgi:hypothetical protein